MQPQVAITVLHAILQMALADVNIPAGFEIIHITDDPYYSGIPSINNCGQVVFSLKIDNQDALQEIYFYDNGVLYPLTNDTIEDNFPDINDRGDVVWTHDANGSNGGIITLLKDGDALELGEGDTPSVNNLGHVIWRLWSGTGCGSAEASIRFYDGLGTVEVADDSSSNQSPDLNDSDQLIWTRYNFCLNPWDSRIMLHSEQQTIPLPTQGYGPQVPSMNNAGQVAWSWGGAHGEVEIWQDGKTSTLTDWGINPRINESGNLFFLRKHDDTDTWQAWLYLDGEFLQLTDDPFWNTDGDINDYNEVAWQADSLSANDIYMLRRVRNGDFDNDGDVDLVDFASLQRCFSGTGVMEPCECRFLDIDEDGDVDLADFGLFQANVSGPR